MAFTTPPIPPPSSPFINTFSSQPWNHPSNITLLPTRRRRQSPTLAFSISNPFTSPDRNVLVRDIKIIRPKKLPQTLVRDHLMPLKGRKVSIKTINTCVDTINKWFTDNFYVCSRLLVVHMPGIFDGNLVLYSAEPHLNEIKCVQMDKENNPVEGGSIRTRENTIANAIGLHRGDTFSWRPEGFAKLLALGIFDYANAEVKVINNENVDLILYLRERPAGRVEPGVGLTSDGRFYGDLSITDNNLMGRAQRFRIAWQKKVDLARSAGGIAFEDMRIGARIPFSYKFRAYRDSNSGRRVPNGSVTRSLTDTLNTSNTPEAPQTDSSSRHEKDRDGVLFEMGYRPKSTNWMLSVSPIFEAVHPHNGDFTQRNSIFQLVAQTCLSYITRLPINMPRSGRFVRLEQSIGTTLTDTSNTFRKTILTTVQYIGIGKQCSMAFGSNMGLASDNLPWHEQKSLGGMGTVRGYGYGELGRYKSFAVGRAEFRVPLTFNSETDTNNIEEEQKAKEPEKLAEKESDTSKSIIPTNLFEKLPPLVGFVFGDSAATIEENRLQAMGSSYGLGVRIGGTFTVEWVSTGDGKHSSVQFGLVDRGW